MVNRVKVHATEKLNGTEERYWPSGVLKEGKPEKMCEISL